MTSYEQLSKLVSESKIQCDPVWLKRELHSVMQAGESVAQYFLDNIGKGHKNTINSHIGYVIGCTDEYPAGLPNLELNDLPDIDIDFSDTKRHLAFSYLQEKYGYKHVSKLGNINTLKPLSVMAVVGKRFNIPYIETDELKNTLFEYASADERFGHSLEDTITKTNPGRKFISTRPVEADCLSKLEMHPSHAGVHAAAIIVCNEPIQNYCTVNEEGIAQIDKYDADYLNLLKIDALGLRTLGIIEDTGVITQEELYGLPLDDAAALGLINAHKVCDIFQFSGRAIQMVSNQVDVTGFHHLNHITALGRPGPLSSGMSERYVLVEKGEIPLHYEIPILENYLSDTNGVIVFQEQVMNIVKEVAGFTWDQASQVRRAMSKSMGEEYFDRLKQSFVQGAVNNGHDAALSGKLWDEIASFGAWGFNESHSVSYAIITYWCLYVKAHWPLEWAAANLRGSKGEDQTIEILREMVREGVEYTAIDPDLSELDWVVRDGKLLGGIQNVVGYGPVKAAKYLEKRNAGILTQQEKDKLAAAKVLYCDLNEAHTLFGALYRKPRLAGVYDPILQISEAVDREEGIFIFKLVKKVLSDEMEPQRLKRRNGKPWLGPSEFMDMHGIDDSVSAPMNFRIRPAQYNDFGKDIYENEPKGTWWLCRGWKINGLGMLIVKKIKKLDPDKYKDM